MSARRRKTDAEDGFYPNLSTRDILREGHVYIMRNVAGHKFGARDAVRIDVGWNELAELPAALVRAQKEEKVRGAQMPFAWDPEFGYLSPQPELCGNSIYIGCMVHLEALSLLGDLKCVLAGLNAVRVDAWGYEADNLHDIAHVYRLENRFSIGLTAEDLLRRILSVYEGLVTQELNARNHLAEEAPRVLADSVARALAILRAARLVSPWELADLLSPIRMADSMGFIKGISKEEMDDFTFNQFAAPPDRLDSNGEERARDKRDASLADRLNRRFARVDFNDFGKDILEL